jgi:hypothetical protein
MDGFPPIKLAKEFILYYDAISLSITGFHDGGYLPT